MRSVDSAIDRGSESPTPRVHAEGPERPPQVTPQVKSLVRSLEGERTRSEILSDLGLKDRLHLAAGYLRPALAEGLVEMTYPDSPRSRKQRYRLTDKGRALRELIRPARDEMDREARHAAQQAPYEDPSCTRQVARLVRALDGERTRSEIQQILCLNDRSHLAANYLTPAIADGLVEMTLPDKPRSSKQKYHLTDMGRSLQARLRQD